MNKNHKELKLPISFFSYYCCNTLNQNSSNQNSW